MGGYVRLGLLGRNRLGSGYLGYTQFSLTILELARLVDRLD